MWMYGRPTKKNVVSCQSSADNLGVEQGQDQRQGEGEGQAWILVTIARVGSTVTSRGRVHTVCWFGPGPPWMGGVPVPHGWGGSRSPMDGGGVPVPHGWGGARSPRDGGGPGPPWMGGVPVPHGWGGGPGPPEPSRAVSPEGAICSQGLSQLSKAYWSGAGQWLGTVREVRRCGVGWRGVGWGEVGWGGGGTQKIFLVSHREFGSSLCGTGTYTSIESSSGPPMRPGDERFQTSPKSPKHGR